MFLIEKLYIDPQFSQLGIVKYKKNFSIYN